MRFLHKFREFLWGFADGSLFIMGFGVLYSFVWVLVFAGRRCKGF